MISVFLREQKRYSQIELVELFSGSEGEVADILKRLKSYGVLKSVKADEKQRNLTDLQENDVEIADVEVGKRDYYYVFTFVGVITINNRVLKCFPKYIYSKEEPVKELKQVLKVIERFNKREQLVKLANEVTGDMKFNMLAATLWFLNDYHENGVYDSLVEVIETNGSGEILWDKTINEMFAVINRGRPYYPELYTRRRINNEDSYFKRLHECILTKCTRELEAADLIELFDIVGADLSDEELDSFGDANYILYRIEKELNTQFNTRKQLVLRMMYSYIENMGLHIDDTSYFSMYGTNSFNLIWEKACSEVLSNNLDDYLGVLDLPGGLADEYSPRQRLRDIINHPIWKGELGGIAFEDEKDTLIPDIICLYREDKECRCAIFDAKYYNLEIDRYGHIQGQPGIESITKQYLYQLAYMEFLKDHAITHFRNCFLMPTEEEEIKDVGTVEINLFRREDLDKIKIRLLPAEKIYSRFLNNKKLKIEELQL